MKILLYLSFISLVLTSCNPNLENNEEKIENISSGIINSGTTNSGTTNQETNSGNLTTNDTKNNMDNSYQTKKIENGDLVAVMTTTNGTIKIKLFKEDVINTVNNFIGLTKKGYYKGLIFHRVINNFMIQGGDPKGTGEGGESIYGTKFDDEFSSKLSNIRGSISMANAGANTNGSQFFINQKDNNYLDNKHSVFGQIYEGLENVDKIAKAQTGANDRPLKDIKIINLEIKKYQSGSLVDYNVGVEDLIKEYKKNIEKKKEENKNRVVKNGDEIAVNYTGKFIDGKVFDTSLGEGRAPIEFVVGEGKMIKGFDSGVVGMKIGDKKTLKLEPKDAYGEYDETRIQEVPKKDLKSFTDAGIKLEKGALLPTQMGRLKIKDVKKDSVIIDLNSEMAGKTLIFEIELVSFKNGI